MGGTGGPLRAFFVVQQGLSECRNVVAYAIQRLREELSFYGETFPRCKGDSHRIVQSLP